MRVREGRSNRRQNTRVGPFREVSGRFRQDRHSDGLHHTQREYPRAAAAVRRPRSASVPQTRRAAPTGPGPLRGAVGSKARVHLVAGVRRPNQGDQATVVWSKIDAWLKESRRFHPHIVEYMYGLPAAGWSIFLHVLVVGPHGMNDMTHAQIAVNAWSGNHGLTRRTADAVTRLFQGPPILQPIGTSGVADALMAPSTPPPTRHSSFAAVTMADLAAPPRTCSLPAP